MERIVFNVQGVGKFAHITKIRQAHKMIIETWVNSSEDRTAAKTVTQAKKFLVERVDQLRAAGCVVDLA